MDETFETQLNIYANGNVFDRLDAFIELEKQLKYAKRRTEMLLKSEQRSFLDALSAKKNVSF